MKLSIIATCFAMLVSSYSYAKDTLIFGIVPQQSASKLASQWIPLMNYLSEETGTTIQFATKPSIPEFEDQLAKGAYDISYMNPYHYTVFSRDDGYDAIAKAKNKLIKGIVVVRKDSEIQSMDELAGNKLAFPAPAAFAASVLSRGYFSQNDIDITPVYVRSHDSVYLNVAKGLFPAGGGVRRTFKAMDPQVTEQLRILWESKGYTPHAIAVSATMPKALKEKLQQALIKLEQTTPELLDPLKFQGFVAAQDSDWDDVRELALNVDLSTK